MSDSRLQEIVTKAVVGRAERRMSWSHTVPAEGITGVYGVRVTDSAVGIKSHDDRPVVDMIVDCDLWCGTQKNTKVFTPQLPHRGVWDELPHAYLLYREGSHGWPGAWAAFIPGA